MNSKLPLSINDFIYWLLCFLRCKNVWESKSTNKIYILMKKRQKMKLVSFILEYSRLKLVSVLTIKVLEAHHRKCDKKILKNCKTICFIIHFGYFRSFSPIWGHDLYVIGYTVFLICHLKGSCYGEKNGEILVNGYNFQLFS
jgi:hypothetical protein